MTGQREWTPRALRENTYGVVKRLQFFVVALDAGKAYCAQDRPLHVLDLGCGTGELVTLPLAAAGYHMTGVDVDEESITYAERRRRALGLATVRFIRASLDAYLATTADTFDAVICSEILEHLEHPEQTLAAVRTVLKRDGLLLVTIPNGVGPFEVETLVWQLLVKLGIVPTLLAVRRRLGLHAPSSSPEEVATLALDSPHRQFYTFREVVRLVTGAGFELLAVRNRTVVCGPFTDGLQRGLHRVGLGEAFLRWNNELADRMPRALVSDWMIAARKSDESAHPPVTPLGRALGTRAWMSLKRFANGASRG